MRTGIVGDTMTKLCFDIVFFLIISPVASIFTGFVVGASCIHIFNKYWCSVLLMGTVARCPTACLKFFYYKKIRKQSLLI
jgi:hypothetical protein